MVGYLLLLTFPISLFAESGNGATDAISCDSCANCSNTNDSVVIFDFVSIKSESNSIDHTRNAIPNDSSVFQLPPKKNLLKAFGEGVFVNTFVWAADRWLLGKDYYSKGWSTFKDNIDAGWMWDTDAFSTNFIDHPYHGNLYFTAAKSSGCTFWESFLLTALGSLEWEEIAETDFPAPNDIFSTSFGGAALGEVTSRVSDILLNGRKRGIKRVVREVAAFGIAPMKGFNRILSGKTWQHDEQHYLYHDKTEIPYTFFLSAGGRWADTSVSSTRSNTSFSLRLDYGTPQYTRHNKPFDCFTTDIGFNVMGTHVPLVSKFNINGRLHGWQLVEHEKWNSVFSLNQDFCYYNNEQQERFEGDRRKLLNLTETAALGPALTVASPSFRHVVTSNLVFMGGYTSDYYYRAYNMGSGFNVKTYNSLHLSDRLYLNLDASWHYMFTWKGYEEDQNRRFKEKEVAPPFDYNTTAARKAGDKGYAVFFIVNPRLDVRLFNNVYASAEYALFTRNSIYRFHPNVNARYSDLKLSLSFKIQ